MNRSCSQTLGLGQGPIQFSFLHHIMATRYFGNTKDNMIAYWLLSLSYTGIQWWVNSKTHKLHIIIIICNLWLVFLLQLYLIPFYRYLGQVPSKGSVARSYTIQCTVCEIIISITLHLSIILSWQLKVSKILPNPRYIVDSQAKVISFQSAFYKTDDG